LLLWIENSVVPFRAPFITKDPSLNDGREINQRKVDLAAVEEATSRWHQASPHTGNDNFYSYALSLRSAGMSLEQIKAKLEEQAQAQFARSPDERKNQIPGILKSLRPPKAG
jgi:hypothetical protein